MDFDIDTESINIAGFQKSVKKYLKHPESSEIRDTLCTLLRFAISVGDDKSVELLVKFGVDFDYKNPLKFALLEGSPRCVEILLENGAKLDGPTWKNERNSPAVMVFDRTKDVHYRKEILQILLKHGLDAAYRNPNYENLLWLYFINLKKEDSDAVDITRILLDAGVRFDEADNDISVTPMFWAIRSENLALIAFLLERGADIKKPQPLILLAAQHDNVELIDLLLKKGADLHSRDFRGDTALHVACEFNCEKVISFLIEKGVDVGAKNKFNETPFYQLRFGTGEKLLNCTITMVKEFSKLKFENRLISQEDLTLIQSDLISKGYFESSTKELFQMSSTEFYSSNTYYSVLMSRSMGIKKLANLAKNEELVSKFETYLQKLLYYKNDLKKIWDEAIRVKEEYEIIMIKLNSVFGHYLPYLVINKLAANLTLEDLP